MITLMSYTNQLKVGFYLRRRVKSSQFSVCERKVISRLTALHIVGLFDPAFMSGSVGATDEVPTCNISHQKLTNLSFYGKSVDKPSVHFDMSNDQNCF